MENVQNEILALREQERIFKEELTKLGAADPVDTATYNAISAELDNVHGKIEAIEEANRALESKVAEAQEQVTQSFDSITAGDQTLTLGDLALNEPARAILSTYFAQYVTGLTEQHAQEIATLQTSYESQLSESRSESDRLQAQYDKLWEEHNNIRIANAQLHVEIADLTGKRDAAAAELENERKEVARLNSQVDDLRAEIAIGAREAVKIETNLNGNLGEMMKKFKDALKPVYNVQEKDRLTLTAQLASTGETVEVLKIYFKGTYREVTPEEAERFRAEQAANQEAEPVQADPIPDSPLVIEAPPLPSEAEVPDVDNTVDGEPVDTAVETVTRAEFEALKARVESLEGVKVEVAA